MSGEIPQQPEIEKTPESRLFDVDAMSNEQITVLWRSLAGTAYQLCEAQSQDQSASEALDVCDGLWQSLVREMHSFALCNPEQAKDLIERSFRSLESLDREFAARVAPSLIDFDYKFTRDVMVYLNVSSNHLGGLAGGTWSEIAWDCTSVLMRDRLTPEQINDFNAHLTAHGEEHELDPATPDMEYWNC
ncbi:hypothetical protein [Streptomyces sp. NPDC006996]|uniref:hypothetical protein n=1 Tax=Streptomyces sp. NPDC006996 TaxID=3156908 RepID=UPI0033FB6073